MVWSDPNPLERYVVQPPTCGLCGEPGADPCAACTAMLQSIEDAR